MLNFLTQSYLTLPIYIPIRYRKACINIPKSYVAGSSVDNAGSTTGASDIDSITFTTTSICVPFPPRGTDHECWILGLPRGYLALVSSTWSLINEIESYICPQSSDEMPPAATTWQRHLYPLPKRQTFWVWGQRKGRSFSPCRLINCCQEFFISNPIYLLLSD